MKQLHLLFFVISFSIISLPQDFNWLKQCTGTSINTSAGMCVDAEGYSLITGKYNGVAVHGQDTLQNLGQSDVYLSKLDPQGNFLWTVVGGGSGADYSDNVTFDNNGNCLIVGRFSATAYFGDTMVTSLGSFDAFIAKYDANGNFIWIKTDGGSASNISTDIAVGSDGSIYTTGNTSGTAAFGNDTITASGVYPDFYYAKYDSNGNNIWAKSEQGPTFDAGLSIDLDQNDNLYLTGFFYETINFGGIIPLTSLGQNDMFIAKYDQNGVIQWAESYGGTDTDAGINLHLGLNGIMYSTSTFRGTAIFGQDTATSYGGNDAVLIKMDTSGNVLWIQQIGSVSSTVHDEIADLEIDKYGNPYITGFFGATLVIGDSTYTTYGSSDIFLAKFDGSKKLQGLIQCGGTGGDKPTAVVVDDNLNIYTQGYFYLTALFGSTNLTSTGSSDIYIGKLTPDAIPVELSSFIAEVKDNNVFLKWKTATELNSKGFELQRKENKSDWTILSFVKGAGTSTTANQYSFNDTGLLPGKYTYRLKQIDLDGTFSYSDDISVYVGVPLQFNLYQNYPNPFNPSTTISYDLAEDAFVSLKVYDILGRQTAVIVNEYQEAGRYNSVFDASDLSSGIYIYELKANNFISTGKMILNK